MYRADYHTHSRVSPDGRDSMLALAEAAVAAGLDEICFTDHFEPVEPRSTTLRSTYDWGALEAEYAQALAQWSGPVRLGLGLELGDALVDLPTTERLLAQAPALDFVIGSVHMLSPAYDSQDLAWLREPDEAACQSEIQDYLAQTLRMAQWGQFDVLGHLTLPLRYMNEQRGFSVSMNGYGAEIAEILRALIHQGRGIEVNTNRGGQPLPSPRWLMLYRELGGEIVTLGSDAHRCADVGRGIREGQALLRQCGFTRFCTFERRQPVWHPL